MAEANSRPPAHLDARGLCRDNRIRRPAADSHRPGLNPHGGVPGCLRILSAGRQGKIRLGGRPRPIHRLQVRPCSRDHRTSNRRVPRRRDVRSAPEHLQPPRCRCPLPVPGLQTDRSYEYRKRSAGRDARPGDTFRKLRESGFIGLRRPRLRGRMVGQRHADCGIRPFPGYVPRRQECPRERDEVKTSLRRRGNPQAPGHQHVAGRYAGKASRSGVIVRRQIPSHSR